MKTSSAFPIAAVVDRARSGDDVDWRSVGYHPELHEITVVKAYTSVRDASPICTDGGISAKGPMDRDKCVTGLFPVADGIGVCGGHDDERTPGRRRRLREERDKKVSGGRRVSHCTDTRRRVENEGAITVEEEVARAEVDDDAIGRVKKGYTCTKYPRR